MVRSRAGLLKRIRYGRRLEYGDFAPWEMDEDDPRQAEYKENPDKIKSLPREQWDAESLTAQYLPRKYDLSHAQLAHMGAQYLGSHKLLTPFFHFLKERYPADMTKLMSPAGSPHHLLEQMRRAGILDAGAIRDVSIFVNRHGDPGHFYENLDHNGKMSRLTGR